MIHIFKQSLKEMAKLKNRKKSIICEIDEASSYKKELAEDVLELKRVKKELKKSLFSVKEDYESAIEERNAQRIIRELKERNIDLKIKLAEESAKHEATQALLDKYALDLRATKDTVGELISLYANQTINLWGSPAQKQFAENGQESIDGETDAHQI